MAYRCVIYDEERRLDEELRRVLEELARAAAALPARTAQDAEHHACRPGRPDASWL
jgi:hypothetical protein